MLREELVTEVRLGCGHIDGVKTGVLEANIRTSLLLDGLVNLLSVCAYWGEEVGLCRFGFFLLLLNPD